MNRIVWVALIAIAAGGAAGYGASTISYHWTRDHFAPNNAQNPFTDIASPPDKPLPTTRARVQVMNGELFDFGKMGRNGAGARTFLIRNIGNAPLRLRKGETTCKCTLSTVDDGEVASGETVEVRLEWTAKTETTSFSQLAEILTNDPERPVIQLRIEGLVEDAVRVTPETILFRNVTGNESQTRKIFVLGADKSMTLGVAEWELVQKRLEPYFDVAVRDATAEEIASHPPAETGKVLELTLNAGLPTGDIQQTLRVKTTLDGAPDFFVSIEGNVLSDVSVVARGAPFDSSHSVLRLGSVDQAAGAKAELLVLIKGPNRNEVRIEIEAVDPPEALRATLGTPKASEKMVTVPLTIEVPAGAPRVTRLGSAQGKMGQIRLRPLHSHSKELPIYVQFSVN